MKLLIVVLVVWLTILVLALALIRGAALLSAEDNPREPTSH